MRAQRSVCEDHVRELSGGRRGLLHESRHVRVGILIVGVLFSYTIAVAEPVELRNDDFESGMPAYAQGGFEHDEIAAVRLDPPEPGRYRIDSVRLVLAGDEREVSVGIYIWEESGEAAPGQQIYYGTVELTGSNEHWQDVSLGTEVVVEGPFRVGIQFYYSGFPGIVRDIGPMTYREYNFIDEVNLGWIFMGDFPGLPPGDWVIRAFVEPIGDEAPEPEPEPMPEPGPEPSTPDAGVPTPDAGPEGPSVPPDDGDPAEPMDECHVHSECPVAQYCSSDKICTYDCRVSTDCMRGMRCTNQGMCERNDTGGGCDSNSGQPSSPAWLLLLGILGLLRLTWRRRRSLS